MSLVRSTKYAPIISKALDGIFLAYKPAGIRSSDLINELKERISDSLNEYQPRPLSKRLLIEGGYDEEKSIVEIPNLADHPLVVGPRYAPWEQRISVVLPGLALRSSGLLVLTLGSANKYFLNSMKKSRFISVYHISGCFGYATDNFFADGKIIDKATFKHIRSGKMDAVLSKIESTQRNRLFDSASVPLESEEAYELAKAWPSRPSTMARWPVIYRIRCIHLKPPDFKIEVTIGNENETLLAQLSQDIGLMLKSNAYTKSIRRVKMGPFDVDSSLTIKDWDLQSIINHLSLFNEKHKELHQLFRSYKLAMPIRTEYNPNCEEESSLDKAQGK